MDDRVKVLLDRVRETAVTMSDMAGVTARYAGRCAGQMVDIAKLNMRIFDLNAECNELLRAAGQVVYDTHLGQEPRGDVLTGILSDLDEKHADIAELKERIATLRHSRECPACGTLCSRGDKFCKDCGAAL
jgi:hypothetical protein